MANANMIIPFYVSKAGQPLSGAAGSVTFASLMTTAGIDKMADAPAVCEIGGGWYKFEVAFGTAPFDEGDLVGVIDADTDVLQELSDDERFVPVEVRLDFYALARLVNRMSQDKVTGDMLIKNLDGEGILKLRINESESQVERLPEMG